MLTRDLKTKFSILVFSVAVFVVFTATGCLVNGDALYKKYVGAKIWMFPPAISANNQQLIFMYIGPGMDSKWRIGAYDIEDDLLVNLPMDYRYSWENPVYSPDGKYMAVLKACGKHCPDKRKGRWVSLVDDSQSDGDFKSVPISSEDVFQEAPTFSPDGKWVIYFERAYRTGKDGMLLPSSKGLLIKKKSLETGEERIVYSNPDRKGHGAYIHYLSDTELFAKASDRAGLYLHIRDGVDGVPAEKRSGFRWISELGKYPDIVAANTGQVAFIGDNDRWDLAASEVERKAYDLYFMNPNGRGGFKPPRRVTREMIHTNGFTLSTDGKMAALLARESGSKEPHDVWIVNIETGQITKPGIRARIEAEIDAVN